ncbi:MAG: cytochrome c biogenesis protein CcsA [Thermoproteus sp.]
MLVASWAYYLYSFVIQDFSLEPVALDTNVGMPPLLRIGASWSGSGSSLFLFLLFFELSAYFLSKHAGEWFGRSASLVALGVGASIVLYGAFNKFSGGTVGAGLNPLLQSFWVLIHPPLVMAGFALIAASAMALLSRRSPAAERALHLGAAVLFSGMVIGGYWSYVTFGWGGYWAWDPVETAQLMALIVAVATFHVPQSLEPFRRPSLYLAVSAVFLALFVTRTGMSPLHGFASPGAGAYVLLLASLIPLGGALRGLLTAQFSRLPQAPEVLSRALMSLAIFAAAVLLYGSLFVPAIGAALGLNVSPPQQDDGMWFYNTALVPLVLFTLVLAPLAFLNKGRRAFRAYLIVGTAATVAVVMAAAYGLFDYSPKSHLLTNIAVATALVWSALGGAVLVLFAARPGKRLVGLLHLALLVFFVAVVLSMPYAYNRSYFVDYSMEPGASANIYGVQTALKGLKFGMLQGSVDLGPYAGGATYTYASYAVAYGGMFAQQVAPMLTDAKARAFSNPALGLLLNLSQEAPIALGNVDIVVNSTSSLRLINASLWIYTQHSGTGLLSILAYLVANSAETKGLVVGNATVVRLSKPLLLPVGGGLLNISGPVEIGNESFWYLLPMVAYLSAGNQTIGLPYGLDLNLTLYYMSLSPQYPIYYAINSPYWNILTDQQKLAAVAPAVGVVEAPTQVPRGSYMEVDMGIDGSVRKAVIRYEVNGEVSGVHGLVVSVLTVPKGLGDVYMAVFAPSESTQFAQYPAPMLYYVKNITASMPPDKSLAVLALIASGFYLDQLRNMDINTAASYLFNAMMDLYGAASSFDPAALNAVDISVKIVPFVNLLWASAAAVTALLIAYAAMERKE